MSEQTGSTRRWTVRPEGSNWGDFGADDQIGRLNLITPARRRAAAQEVREGIAFCLSLPLDVGVDHPRRKPPEQFFFHRGEDPTMNWPMSKAHPGQTDVVCDDGMALSLQFSTQWDSLCHIGCMHDAHDDGRMQATYYNGYRAVDHVVGPVDHVDGGKPVPGPYGAHALGIETIATTGLQARGVMIDLFAHVGLEKVPVGYNLLMRILEADNVEVEEGDVVCFRTGFDRALLARAADPAYAYDQSRVSGLDGTDERLLQWVEECGAVALVSDNDSVEMLPDMAAMTNDGPRIPLHNLCLFKLGIPLGEMFLLSEIADWLRANGRSRFLFTAPPLRLPGAVGSPVTGVGTV